MIIDEFCLMLYSHYFNIKSFRCIALDFTNGFFEFEYIRVYVLVLYRLLHISDSNKIPKLYIFKCVLSLKCFRRSANINCA